MPLAPGTRLGPYEVIGSIGAGGMGEVYRATDTNLKRQVAIKVLPESLAGDPDRLARFQREAEVLAVLNCPNIAQIYGLEKSSGMLALAMEFVDGEDLAQRIARGPIPLDDALPIAKQIAEALETAHQQGIIHRDLKPANIKVRPDGSVKVLDFGLAKAFDQSRISNPQSPIGLTMPPTLTSPMMTGVGLILGTAAYMAPEQAKGQAVDRRADVWAFGAVLYEMVTGARAFTGDSVTEVLASVLAREPDWSKLPADAPVIAGGVQNIWTVDLATNTRTQVTFAQDLASPFMTWSPDGRELAYGARRGKGFVIAQRPSGGGPERIAFTLPPDQSRLNLPRVTAWATEGSTILYSGTTEGGSWSLPLAPGPSGARSAHVLVKGDRGQNVRLAPGQRWFVYQEAPDAGTVQQVIVDAFPGGGRRQQISARGTIPVWGADGKSLYYADDNMLTMLSVTEADGALHFGPPRVVMPITVGRGYSYDVAKDGRILAIVTNDAEARRPLTLMQNWPKATASR